MLIYIDFFFGGGGAGGDVKLLKRRQNRFEQDPPPHPQFGQCPKERHLFLSNFHKVLGGGGEGQIVFIPLFFVQKTVKK